MIETKITVPEPGYVMRRRVKTVERERAADILTPSVQSRTTCAELDGFAVHIATDAAVCPVCGREMPAYGPGRTKTRAEIEAWASLQTSLFAAASKFLEFMTPIADPGPLTCPECGKKSVLSVGEREVTLRERRGKVSLSVVLKQGDETRLKDIRTPKEGWRSETLTFNLKSGKVYITLKNGDESETRDISGAEYPWPENHPVIKLTDGSKAVRRALKHAFERIQVESLPFGERELSAERLVLLTRFRGFGRDFYRLVPYADEHYRIGRTFHKAARRLRHADRVTEFYRRSGLPMVKSIRKLLFAEPSLLFYADELERLWTLIGNVDLFRAAMSGTVYVNLAYLHMRPSAFRYLYDLRNECGILKMLRVLMAPDRGWLEYAPVYLSYSKEFRKAERRGWKDQKRGHVRNTEYPKFIGDRFSVPLLIQSDAEAKYSADSEIRGFRFERLATSFEYLRAGKALRNCLDDWEEFRGSVYAVYGPDGTCVAAAEVSGNKLHQALSSDNDLIAKIEGLPWALEEWMKANSLEWKYPDEAYAEI